MKRRPWSKSLSRVSPFPLGGGSLSSFIFSVMACICLLFSALNPEGARAVRAGIMDVFAPALGAVGRPIQYATSLVRDVSGLSGLQADNMRLAEENVRLREWYQTALQLEAENKSLRDLLHVKMEPAQRYVTARVLADSSSTFAKSLIVDAGKDDGVEKGQAVISGEGVIGRVVEAGRRSARVLLVTDINSHLPVLIEDSRQQAILEGQNDLPPVLTHFPYDIEITEGARIVTSGDGGIFPPGLPIGRVAREGGVYRVALFVQFDRLVHVRIVDVADDPNLHRGIPDGALD